MKIPNEYMNKLRQHARNLSNFAVSGKDILISCLVVEWVNAFLFVEYYFVGVPPSLVACGAICCAVNSLLQRYAIECRKILVSLTGIEQVCWMIEMFNQTCFKLCVLSFAQESLLQCQWNIDASFEQRLLQLQQSQGVQHKEDDDSSDNAGTPTEIRQLFFNEIQKPHSKSKPFTPAEDGSREH